MDINYSALVTAIGLILTVAGSWGIVRYMLKDHQEQIKKQWDRLDAHYKKIIETEGLVKTKPDMEKIRDTFVEIKMWEMQNKHMDDKLDAMQEQLNDKLNDVLKAVNENRQ